MKKLALILTAAMLLLSLAASAAAGSAETANEIPADVLEYAGGQGMLSMKSFMKDPKNRYIGRLFSSADEIDALKLGKGYRLYGLGGDPYEWKDTLLGSGAYTDKWMFTLDDGEGPVALFFVKKQDGGFSYSGANAAANFNSALAIVEKLADSEGAAFAPVVAAVGDGLIIAHDFNGHEGLISVPGDVFELDAGYSKVKNSSELPVFDEYKAQVVESLVPASEYMAGTATGGDGLTLKPHLSKPGLPVIAAAAAVGAAVIALAVIGSVKYAKKRAQ